MEINKELPTWPDMTIDQEAWREAQGALGATATLSEVLTLAQEIKTRLRG